LHICKIQSNNLLIFTEKRGEMFHPGQFINQRG
jgi:hypothetical protein